MSHLEFQYENLTTGFEYPSKNLLYAYHSAEVMKVKLNS